jgi:phosphatidylglycerol:prolipoprotein diacylglycerol transferase
VVPLFSPVPGVVVSSWTTTAVIATLLAAVVFLRGTRAVAATVVRIELTAVAVLAGWLGAKVGHVVLEATGHVLADGRVARGIADLVADDPGHVLRLFDPGHVFYGGVLGALIGVVAYARRARLGSMVPILDAAVPALAVGIAVGRCGCFLAGCCHGVTSTVPWAVRYAPPHPTGGALVHPVQIYDAGVGLLLLGGWVVACRRGLPASVRVPALIAAYAVLRIATEALRGDGDRGMVGPLSTSQAISVIVLLVAVASGVRASCAAGAGTLSTHVTDRNLP